MTSFIHLSDTHFGTEDPRVVEDLCALVTAQRPGLVVFSGDVTQRARRVQFAAARRFVDRLGLPALVIAGNHDIPLFNLFARWRHPYAGFLRAFGDLEPVFRAPGLHVVGVDSTTPRRHKDGELDATTIRRACERLDASEPGVVRVVVMHHPLLAITDSDIANLAHGHREALAAFAECGVDLVLGGHIHLPYVRPAPDPVVDPERRMWIVQAGTAVSTRTRDGQPNSVHLVRYDAEGCRVLVVEQWDHDADEGRFMMVRCVPVTLDRSGQGSLAGTKASNR
jgi:3',5'-cyclic AMP phosphodiesterase CpdA